MFPADPQVRSTLSRPNQLFHQLGSFWRDYLSDAELLRLQTWTELQQAADAHLRLTAAEQNGSIQTLLPFVERQWRLVRLLESELTQSPNVVQYGSGPTYGDGTVYGQLRQESFVWQLPSEIHDLGLLLDNPVAPTRVYDVSNCHFDPATHVLSFVRNPFNDIVSETVYDSAGNPSDRQLLLWARNTTEDHGLPYLRYGAVLGMSAPVGGSSQTYCEVLRATWSLLVQGPSLSALRAGFLASSGLPLTRGDETVERVEVDDQHLCIVTDRNVYRLHAGATPLVAAGARLAPGQELVDTIQVHDFSGAARPWSALPGLPAGPGLISTPGDLLFPNVDEAWVAGPNGVQFTVLGSAQDVTAFWDAVALRATAAGTTLSALVGGVGAAVNPLKFVVENCLAANLIVVTMKPEHFQGFQGTFAGRLPGLLPAGTLLLVVTALQATNDVLYLDDPSLAAAETYDASWAEDTGPTLLDVSFPPAVS